MRNPHKTCIRCNYFGCYDFYENLSVGHHPTLFDGKDMDPKVVKVCKFFNPIKITGEYFALCNNCYNFYSKFTCFIR